MIHDRERKNENSVFNLIPQENIEHLFEIDLNKNKLILSLFIYVFIFKYLFVLSSEFVVFISVWCVH
jgi:hypothetical protein